MCDPCKIPYYNPCDANCGQPYNERSIQCYSGTELEAIAQCPPRCPPPTPKCITIQQPPRLICKKRIVFINKIIPEPMVVNRFKQITIPKAIETTKVIKVPKLTWVSQIIKEPRIIYHPKMVPDPYVINYPRKISVPKEICQMVLCQPKPQKIYVPPPPEYCCYPTGPTKFISNFECPIDKYNPYEQNMQYSVTPVPYGIYGLCSPSLPSQCSFNSDCGSYGAVSYCSYTGTPNESLVSSDSFNSTRMGGPNGMQLREPILIEPCDLDGCGSYGQFPTPCDLLSDYTSNYNPIRSFSCDPPLTGCR